MLNLEYIGLAMRVNKRFKELVTQAREGGEISAQVPDDVIIYTLYARSCDPTVEFLKQDGKLTDEQIVEAMVAATFGGLGKR
jgi:hypothetical protein